jgi:hypothetical protein
VTTTPSLTVIAIAVMTVLFGIVSWIAIAVPMLRAPRKGLLLEMARSLAIAIGPSIVVGTIMFVLSLGNTNDDLPFLLVPTPVAAFLAPSMLCFFAALAYRLHKSPGPDES